MLVDLSVKPAKKVYTVLLFHVTHDKVKTTERQLPAETVRGQPVVHDFPVIKKTSTSHISYSQPCV